MLGPAIGPKLAKTGVNRACSRTPSMVAKLGPNSTKQAGGGRPRCEPAFYVDTSPYVSRLIEDGPDETHALFGFARAAIRGD